MPNTVTLAYSATATQISSAALQAAMAAVPLYRLGFGTQDPMLGELGLSVASDTTAPGSPTVRTLVLNLAPAAGVPNAPPFFTSQLPLPAKGTTSTVAVYSTNNLDTSNLSLLAAAGARQVSVSYVDSTGAPGTVVVNLQGRTPVVVPLAAGTVDFLGGITDFHVSSTGPFGANKGQLTVSLISQNPAGFPVIGSSGIQTALQLQDALQDLLGRFLARIPASYATLDPGFTGAPLLNLFTNVLQKALVAPVTAAAPVFI